MAASTRDDIVDLFDFTYARLRDRMAGLGDEEWRWQPTADADLTLRWRLDHLREVLGGERNGPWLGVAEGSGAIGVLAPPLDSAAATLAALADAYARWRSLLLALDDAALAVPIGAVGGRYGEATRRAFALHIADELVHHGAEAALLRDLYSGRS